MIAPRSICLTMLILGVVSLHLAWIAPSSLRRLLFLMLLSLQALWDFTDLCRMLQKTGRRKVEGIGTAPFRSAPVS